MKKIILLLLALLFPFIGVVPARADKDDYHDVKKWIGHLDDRFSSALALRDRYGSSPDIRDDLRDVGVRLRVAHAQYDQKSASPNRLRDECQTIANLLSRVEDAYSRGAHSDYHPPRRHIIVNF